MSALPKLYKGSTLISDQGLAATTTTSRASAMTVTANSTAHTYGAWTELVASLPAAVGWLSVSAQVGVPSTDTASILSIGIGPMGLETEIFAFACGGHHATGGAVSFPVPIYLPAGTRVSAKLKSVVTGGKTAVVSLGTAPPVVGWQPPATVDVLGLTLASSAGTNIPSSATYQQIVATTAKAYRALVLVPSMRATNVGVVTREWSLGVGASGVEVALGSVWSTNTTAELFGIDPTCSWLPLIVGNVPAGSRLAVACSSVAAPVGAFDATLIGVPYP